MHIMNTSVSAETVDPLSKYKLVKFCMCWLLKEMEDGNLISLLHVTPKTHLRVIKLLQTNPF